MDILSQSLSFKTFAFLISVILFNIDTREHAIDGEKFFKDLLYFHNMTLFPLSKGQGPLTS